MLATACGLSRSSSCAPLPSVAVAAAATAPKSAGARWPSAAKAHSVLLSCWGEELSSSRMRSAPASSAPKSAASAWPTLAYAHATLASPWLPRLSTRNGEAHSAADTAPNSRGCGWRAAPKAQQLLAAICGW